MGKGKAVANDWHKNDWHKEGAGNGGNRPGANHPQAAFDSGLVFLLWP
ncbi:MAG: hypothetical protein ACLQBK_19270 [Candidatus Sulfotelmatobacter sp.]